MRLACSIAQTQISCGNTSVCRCERVEHNRELSIDCFVMSIKKLAKGCIMQSHYEPRRACRMDPLSNKNEPPSTQCQKSSVTGSLFTQSRLTWLLGAEG